TLPLLVRHVENETEGVASSTAWVYGINTAGAAIGCLAAGFILIPSLGMYTTNLIMAVANILIGSIAVLIALPATKGRAPQPTLAGKMASSTHAKVGLVGPRWA